MRRFALVGMLGCIGCGREALAPADGSIAPDGVGDAGDVAPDGEPDGPRPVCPQPGALDPAFGAGGVVTFFGLVQNRAATLTRVTIDETSRIVAVGGFLQGGRGCIVVRLLPDGTRDPSFGENGVVRHDIGQDSCWFNGVALQADGKIVAAGDIDALNARRAVVARYLVDGTPDPTFGDNGVVLAPMGPELETSAMAVAVDAAQGIVVVGATTTGQLFEEAYAFRVRRHLPDGAVDTTFGVAGLAEAPFDNDFNSANGIAIQASGRLLVTGSTGSTFHEGTTPVVAYTPGGRLDPSFGTGGVVLLEGSDGGGDVALDAQGRATISAPAAVTTMLARLTEDGSLDPSFHGTGVLIDAGVPGCGRLGVDLFGRIVCIATSASPSVPMVVRYAGAGRDGTFGTDGFAATAIHPWRHNVIGMTLQPDGSVVTVGGYGTNDRYDAYVVRHCP